MKNIDYVRELPDDKLAQLIAQPACDSCIYYGKDCTNHAEMNCVNGVKAWAQAEHKAGAENEND